MSFPEVLATLRRMALDWRDCIESNEDFYKYALAKGCERGFCNWLAFHEISLDSAGRLVMLHLSKDVKHSIGDPLIKGFWYITILSCVHFEYLDHKEALQTRLDHLNRTIARLEKIK